MTISSLGDKRVNQQHHTDLVQTNRLSVIWYAGPVLLFAASLCYGVLEAHPVNDTWIGLAAGRQILSSKEVPLTDSFSFSVAGKPWYNQNWLTHTAQYWIYDRIGHDAVIIANWIMAGLIFVMVVLAAYWRSGAWTGALMAGSVTALGCRDFLSARPATAGFFCLAALWTLLCRLESQGSKRRWTPIALLMPLFLVWGNMHGSFIFGYAVVGLYVTLWGVLRISKRGAVLNAGQIVTLATVVGAAAALTVMFGPFGLDNFTHGQKVASSAVWRDVAEWQPPYVGGHNFPHMWRFWTILAGAAALLTLAGALRMLNPKVDQARDMRATLRITPFDIIMVGLGLAMTLWARRFAPIFMIFGTPVFLLLVLRLLHPLTPARKQKLIGLALSASGVGGMCIGAGAAYKAYADLVEPYRNLPDCSLLERVTYHVDQPLEAYNFIDNNKLQLRLTAEWSVAGAVMLYAPTAKVFIDGRAQQVYEETHYRQYQALFVATNTPHKILYRLLDEIGADSVLVRNWERGANLWTALEESADWSPVVIYPTYRLYLRNRGDPIEKLGELLRAGGAWWPDADMSEVARGFVWKALRNPEPERAIHAWKTALRKNPSSGRICFMPLTRTMIELGRQSEARQLLKAYLRRLEQDSRFDDAARTQLRISLDACLEETNLEG